MSPIEKYFSGEKIQCLLGVIIASLCIAVTIYFLITQKPLFKGVSFAMLPLSIILLGICTSIVLRTPNHLRRVMNFAQSAPQKLKSEELPRMQKVVNNFKVLKRAELIIFLLAIGFLVLFWKNEVLRGIAFGVMLQTVILFVFDSFAEARGMSYYIYLKSL